MPAPFKALDQKSAVSAGLLTAGGAPALAAGKGGNTGALATGFAGSAASAKGATAVAAAFTIFGAVAGDLAILVSSFLIGAESAYAETLPKPTSSFEYSLLISYPSICRHDKRSTGYGY
jgi:hypothetical protein